MGRPPCCDKLGVKKGPWTPEEDIILVSYIQEHGPGNWRSVPTNTGSDNNSQDNNSSSSSASHQTTSKGQWERRLQTDIHMAKQALYEALSLDKPIYETKQPTQQPSSNPNNILLTPTPTNKVTTMGMSQPSSMSSANTTYASSAENIAKLLENWSKKKSSSGSVSQMTPITTMNSGGSVNGIYPLKIKEQHHVKVGSTSSSEGALSSTTADHQFKSIFDSMMFQEESKPLSMEGQAPQGPLTLLEKWLLFDDGSNAIAGQGQDALLDMSSLDGNAVFF
ncbi:hypothetical protein QQ045_020685 [Rhodiola kirilowii]